LSNYLYFSGSMFRPTEPAQVLCCALLSLLWRPFLFTPNLSLTILKKLKKQELVLKLLTCSRDRTVHWLIV